MIGRAPRKDIALPVRLMFRDSEKALQAHSLNISQTGMLVLSEEARPSGTLVRFNFSEFEGMGAVIWTRDYEPGVRFLALLGIEFFPLEPYDRWVLDELLDASIRRPPRDQAVALKNESAS